MQKQLWTIGHSTRNIGDFIALLKEHEIALLVDVRTLPGSRKFPQFNQQNLSQSLEKAHIAYRHMAGLGGLRKKHPHSHNTIWHNASFRAYADYMETDDFLENAKKLLLLAAKKRICICCSEAVWWHCHRSMIADFLKSKGWQVYHIMGPGKTEEHPYTQPAQLIEGQLTYGPARDSENKSDA